MNQNPYTYTTTDNLNILKSIENSSLSDSFIRYRFGFNVLTKDGGFIGLGKTTKLKGDFNKDYFTKADKRDLKEISIFAKKIKMVTSNPESSYPIEGENKVDKIQITNADAFWQASKYLVIIVD